MLKNNIKEEIKKHWDKNTCDFHKGSFEELDKTRSTIYPYVEKELRFQNLNDKKIIEIGVGSAIESCTVLRNVSPALYTLYDISPITLQRAREHLESHHPNKNIDYRNGDMENICYRGKYDRVYALGSIHHTENPAQAIKEISKIMKKGATFLFMFYCKDSIRYNIIIPYQILRGRGRFAKTRKEFVRKLDGDTNPIGKAYSKKEIKKFCHDVGLKILEMKGYDHGFALYVYGEIT